MKFKDIITPYATKNYTVTNVSRFNGTTGQCTEAPVSAAGGRTLNLTSEGNMAENSYAQLLSNLTLK